MAEGDYLASRAAQELTAAINSPDARVRERHLELADAYSFRLREWKAQEQRRQMLVVQKVPADI